MKPFTATRSMRFVVALYFVRSTDSSTCEKERRTRGDSSTSTWRARRAMRAKRGVGSGMSIVLSYALAGKIGERYGRGHRTESKGSRGRRPRPWLLVEVDSGARTRGQGQWRIVGRSNGRGMAAAALGHMTGGFGSLRLSCQRSSASHHNNNTFRTWR
jgi:hypothetical protein